MHGESDRLSRAGSYVLGLMGEADRERAEHDLEVDPAFREAVLEVAERLHRIELPQTDDGRLAHWKGIASQLGGLPQMRGTTGSTLRIAQPQENLRPIGHGLHAVPTRRALVIGLALVAAFVAGYLAALVRM